MSLGERIQELLDEKQITQRELAARLHVTPNTINGYIKNRRCPDCATLVQIAQHLGTTSDYLLGNTASSLLPENNISPGEDILLKNYRALDDNTKLLLEELSACLYDNQKMGLPR